MPGTPFADSAGTEPAASSPAVPRGRSGGRRVLVTAGPTHEPIDRVRFIGNRSSGRMGLAIAAAAVAAGHEVVLLLGPIPAAADLGPADGGHACVRDAATGGSDSPLRIVRFRSSRDLEAALAEHAPSADLVVMAAAVADYRRGGHEADTATKVRRSAAGLRLDLEPVPDLLAGLAARRPPGQVLVGFALEPAEALEASATAKLRRKGVDAIVANPLETMDAATVTASVLFADGSRADAPPDTAKEAFATWLVAALDERLPAMPAAPADQPGRAVSSGRNASGR